MLEDRNLGKLGFPGYVDSDRSEYPIIPELFQKLGVRFHAVRPHSRYREECLWRGNAVDAQLAQSVVAGLRCRPADKSEVATMAAEMKKSGRTGAVTMRRSPDEPTIAQAG